MSSHRALFAVAVLLASACSRGYAAHFNFSLPALERKHPEITLIHGIVKAMAPVAPLPERMGTAQGRQALYLNGRWQYLPILDHKAEAGGIARTRLFVPSLLHESHALREDYAKARKEWYGAKKMWFSANVKVPERFDRNRPVVLHFEAVDFLGAVFINGKHVMTHAGRFTPFETELDPDDIPGSTFNLSVFVLKSTYAIENNMSWFQLGSSYRKGPPGGITAPVYLYQDTAARIRHVRIVTSVKRRRLQIDCTTEHRPPGMSLQPVVVDREGNEVPGLRLRRQPLRPQHSWRCAWRDPKLWDHESPYLYHVRFDLYEDGRKVDGPAHVERFGFREVEIRGKQILLNGIPVRLFGVSVGQQCASAFGRADEDFNYRYFMILKKHFGVNALRFHHTPAFAPQIMAADRAGMLVINQSGVWTSGRDLNYRGGENTLRNFEKEFGEWVWRDMNSPSTLIWDAANEYICGSPGFIDYWAKFDEIIRRIDSTRIIQQSGAGFRGGKAETVHIHTGYGRDSRLNRRLPAQVDKPVIFGEFLSPKEMEAPRWIFSEGDFNDEYIKTFEDRMAEYRLSGAAGQFPFYSLEDGFIIDPVIPEGQTFSPESFHPKRLFTGHKINPYADIEKQIDGRFIQMTRRVFSPVAGLWHERSHFFEQNKEARRTLYVANDSRAPVRARISVTLELEGETSEALSTTRSLKPGESVDLPVTIPAAAQTGKGVLRVDIAYGLRSYRNEKPAWVLACPGARERKAVALYECTPELRRTLDRLGYRTEILDDLTAYENGTLVVGENSLEDAGKLRTVLDMMQGKVVVLRQDYVEFSSLLGLDYFYSKTGLAPGSAESRANTTARLGRAGVYAPSYDRTLHEQGVVNYDSPGGMGASYYDTYVVPVHDGPMPPNVTTIFSGHVPPHVPCLKFSLADGNFVFCQMPIEEHLKADVRSRMILKRLIETCDERTTFREGSVFTDSPALRKALAGRGIPLSDASKGATLCVVSDETYRRDADANGAEHVLVYGAGDGLIDGRRVRVRRKTSFITFLVSPDISGLFDLTAADFHRIAEGTINKRGGHKFRVPVLALDDSQRAVFGKAQKPRMRVFEEPGGKTVMSYYEKNGGKRWITGFEANESFVQAMTHSIARSLRIPYGMKEASAIRDYYVEGAGDVEVDANLQEWRYRDRDQALHNWRRAMPLAIGEGTTRGTFYCMEDAQNLYLAFATAKGLFGSPADSIELLCGDATIRLRPQAGDVLGIEVGGKPSSGRGVWKVAVDRSGPAVAVEASIPHTELGLAKKSRARLRFSGGGNTVSYPPRKGERDASVYFNMRMKQPRYRGDYPPGGTIVSSDRPRLQVFVGKAQEKKVSARHPRFESAHQVTITESPGKGWKIQLVTGSGKAAIKRGDLLLAVVYARCAKPDGELRVNMRFGQTQDQIADVPIHVKGDTWKRFYARAHANKDYAKGGCVISLSVGSAREGVYEFAEMKIVNFGPDFDPENVPASTK